MKLVVMNNFSWFSKLLVKIRVGGFRRQGPALMNKEFQSIKQQSNMFMIQFGALRNKFKIG